MFFKVYFRKHYGRAHYTTSRQFDTRDEAIDFLNSLKFGDVISYNFD